MPAAVQRLHIPEEPIASMNKAERHLDRAELYLRFALDDFLSQQYPRAANALRRSVTHAATALLAAERRPTRTRRRLLNALRELVHEERIQYGHLLTFRLAHDLPGPTRRLPEESSTGARLRLRVKLFVRDVSVAVGQREPWGSIRGKPALSASSATCPAGRNALHRPGPVQQPGLASGLSSRYAIGLCPPGLPKMRQIPTLTIPKRPGAIAYERF